MRQTNWLLEGGNSPDWELNWAELEWATIVFSLSLPFPPSFPFPADQEWQKKRDDKRIIWAALNPKPKYFTISKILIFTFLLVVRSRLGQFPISGGVSLSLGPGLQSLFNTLGSIVEGNWEQIEAKDWPSGNFSQKIVKIRQKIGFLFRKSKKS